MEEGPAASHGSNTDILPGVPPLPQAITCAVCHPSHHDRVEWGTPIGNYDIVAGAHFAVSVEDEDELCQYCHSGSRHAVYRMPEMDHIKCVDCHMPMMPVARADGSIKMTRTHAFGFPDDPVALAERAYFSCGTDGLGCHGEHDTEWAVEYIESGVIHRAPPPGETWDVQVPFLFSQFWVTLEELGGFLLVETTDPATGATAVALGMEFDGIIFWMENTGSIFFGTIDRVAGTASGIAFGHNGGNSVWFAEKL